MMAYKSAERLKCEKCRKEVIVTQSGEGQLMCCGEAMKIPMEGLIIDKVFVQEWSNRYPNKNNGLEDERGEKEELDWMFREKEPARATLQKAGLWEKEIGDATDGAFLEHFNLIKELSAKLNVTPRELGKALFAYEKLGIYDRRCPYCNGTGKVDGPTGGDAIVACPACKGRRYNFVPDDSQLCRKCHGTGEFIYASRDEYVKKLCLECKGIGWVPPTSLFYRASGQTGDTTINHENAAGDVVRFR